MVERIGAAGSTPAENVSPSGKPSAKDLKNAKVDHEERETSGVTVSISLQSVMQRVREAEAYRKERVHQVLEKIQDGTLLSSEALREAADRILREGP